MAVHLAKGARDFLPDQMRNRLAVMAILRDVFERFGFEPLDTPAFERIETLTGKYGDEGEKLMFRILKRGEGGKKGEVDMALRYDLTVPLARVVAMNPSLRMPFKRYQMAPVWRADRPQRGRFREFYQCDVDIVGTTSTLADAECIAVVAASLDALGFDNYVVRLNDRRILRAMARAVGAIDQETALLVAVDKLDKVGRDGVSRELEAAGFGPSQLETLWSILDVPRGHGATLDALAAKLDNEGCEGVEVLREVLQLALDMGVSPDRVVVDPTLARGLDYYTGPVYETEVLEPKIGSISGGGRYDGLVGIFGKRDVPAVGVSLGLERLITVMEELGRLPTRGATAQVLVTVFSREQAPASLALAHALRSAGVRVELFTDDKKMKAQFKYANARGFEWLAICGPDEVEAGVVVMKHLASGEQHRVLVGDAASLVLR